MPVTCRFLENRAVKPANDLFQNCLAASRVQQIKREEGGGDVLEEGERKGKEIRLSSRAG